MKNFHNDFVCFYFTVPPAFHLNINSILFSFAVGQERERKEGKLTAAGVVHPKKNAMELNFI